MKTDFKARTIATYSVNRKTGKSTVARELAGFCQISGKKTLLVDFTLGKSGFLGSKSVPGKPDLSDWLSEIDKKLRKFPWHDIRYSPEEVLEYTDVNAAGLSILTCSPGRLPERMQEAAGVILSSLAGLNYDLIVLDLDSEIRDYIILVLSSVDTVLLVTDTYRYDVAEVKMVMERLKEAGCRMGHFKVVFNKKPSFFDDTPPQIAHEFNLPMAGSLPDYPRLSMNFLMNTDQISEYSLAMKKLIDNIYVKEIC